MPRSRASSPGGSSLDYVAICIPHGAEWRVFEAGSPSLTPEPGELSAAASPRRRRTAASGERVGAALRAAAARRQVDRPARRGGTPERERDARRGRRPHRHRHRAGAVSRRSKSRRHGAPGRSAEVGAARLARPRSANAADRDPRGRQQPAGVVARRTGAARAERPDPDRGRSADAPVPEHPRDGAHRCRRDHRGHALGVAVGNHRGGAQPRRAGAARPVDRDCGGRGSPRAARSAPDRGGAVATARERRAVLTARLADRRGARRWPTTA